MSKYGKAMAAVLCMALLGIGYFSVQHAESFSDKGVSADSVATNEVAKQECAVAEEPEAAFEEVQDTDSETQGAQKAETEEAEMGKMTTDSAAAVSGTTDLLGGFSGKISEDAKEVDDQKRKDYQSSSASYIAQAQGMPLLGAYVPTSWPENGAVMQLISNGGTVENPVCTAWLFWSYDYLTEGFDVQITGYQNFEEWMEAEIAEGDVVYAKDYTRSYVESRMQPVSDDRAGLSATEYELVEGYFGVLYEEDGQYVLVHFGGVGTMDQIWTMMQ